MQINKRTAVGIVGAVLCFGLALYFGKMGNHKPEKISSKFTPKVEQIIVGSAEAFESGKSSSFAERKEPKKKGGSIQRVVKEREIRKQFLGKLVKEPPKPTLGEKILAEFDYSDFSCELVEKPEKEGEGKPELVNLESRIKQMEAKVAEFKKLIDETEPLFAEDVEQLKECGDYKGLVEAMEAVLALNIMDLDLENPSILLSEYLTNQMWNADFEFDPECIKRNAGVMKTLEMLTYSMIERITADPTAASEIVNRISKEYESDVITLLTLTLFGTLSLDSRPLEALYTSLEGEGKEIFLKVFGKLTRISDLETQDRILQVLTNQELQDITFDAIDEGLGARL